MQQPNAPMPLDCLICELSAYSPSYVRKSTASQDNSNNTNSLANLARVSDRVQISECDRRTRLMSLTIPVTTSPAAPQQP
eukprot:4850143-Pyramimonas_sp.AAC.1